MRIAIKMPAAGWIAISSGIVFAVVTFGSFIFPKGVAAEIAFALVFAQLWAGVLGMLLYNIFMIEFPDSGREVPFNWLIPALIGALGLLNPPLGAAGLLLLRFGVLRGREGAKPTLFKKLGAPAIIFIVFLLIAVFFTKTAAVVIATAFLTLFFTTLSNKTVVWQINPIAAAKSLNCRAAIRILYRISLDLYIFSISLCILAAVKHSLSGAEALLFVKIYSSMAVSGVFITIIESKILSRTSDGYGVVPLRHQTLMSITCTVFVVCWSTIILRVNALDSVLAGTCTAIGVFNANRLAMLRTQADPREIALIAAFAGLLLLATSAWLLEHSQLRATHAFIGLALNLYSLQLVLFYFTKRKGTPL